MIFLGDIASPFLDTTKKLDDFFLKNNIIFKDKSLICNLEGLITDDRNWLNSNHPILFNNSSVLKTLNKYNCKVACLANNHTLDIPEFFENTVCQLEENQIGYCGASTSYRDAQKPYFFKEKDHDVFLFNSCWSLLLQHQKNPTKGVYVNELDELSLKNDIEEYRIRYPHSSIIVYLHWNLDLEWLPFPMYRQFTQDLIDSGANLVIGTHSHCVQGAEAYKEGYIVYGLGNFFVPWWTFINGTIHFPEFAKTELAFEWQPESNKAKVHFFQYDYDEGNHSLNHLETTNFEQSELLKYYSPYAGMDNNDYLTYFKGRRRKKGGVPVYKNYHNRFENKFKDKWLIYRITLARLLAGIKLREWNN